MSRLFDDSNTEYLEVAAALVTDTPLTMAAWFNSNDTGTEQTVISIGQAALHDYFALRLMSWGPIRAITFNGAATGAATSTANYSANTWHHICGVFTAEDNRAVFLNGGNKGTNTTNVAIDTIDNTAIGRAAHSNKTWYMSGMVAEAAIWNAALTDGEAAILATGASPLMVRPQSLVFYTPLLRNEDRDIVGGLSLTPANAPTIADHPRVWYPGRTQTGIPAGTTPPVSAIAAHRYVALSMSAVTGTSRAAALAKQMGNTKVGLASAFGANNMARLLDDSVGGLATARISSVFSREASDDASGSAIALGQREDARIAAASLSATADAEAIVGLQHQLDAVVSTAKAILESLGFSLSLGNSVSGISASLASLAEGRVTDMGTASSAGSMGAVELSRLLDVANYAMQSVLAVLGLARDVGIDHAGWGQSAASQQLGSARSLQSVAEAGGLASVGLQYVALLVVGTAQAILESLGFSLVLGDTASAIADTASSVLESKQLGDESAAVVAGLAALEIARRVTVNLFTGQVLLESLSLAREHGLAQDAQAQATAAQTLAMNLADNMAGSATALSAIGLYRSAYLASTYAQAIQETLSLARRAEVSDGATAGGLAEAELQHFLVTALSGYANAYEALFLEVSSGVDVQGQAGGQAELDLGRLDALLLTYLEAIGVFMRKQFGLKTGTRQPYEL